MEVKKREEMEDWRYEKRTATDGKTYMERRRYWRDEGKGRKGVRRTGRGRGVG